MFETLLGNESIKSQIETMVERGRVGQSLLFAGPEGIGKSLFARELAHKLLKSTKEHHPDLHVYKPQGKIGMHAIDAMRSFTEEVYLSPLEAHCKVFIIEDAERMLTYSANALLKTFEEPAADSVIILVSGAPDKLLSTIRSRCRTMRFAPIPKKQIAEYLVKKGVDSEVAEKRAHLANGSLLEALKESNPLREHTLDLISQEKWRTWGELSAAAGQLASEIEQDQKELRDSLQTETKELTATQRQAIERELDGTLSVRLMHHANTIFLTLLNWFRDLELIHVNGSQLYLTHIDRYEALKSAYARDERLPLTTVDGAVREAKTALDRSTPLTQTLENLFLKLERIA